MTVKESIFHDILRLFVWYPLRWLIIVIPVKWGIAILRTMGDVYYLFSKDKKTMILNNLSRLKVNIGMGHEGDNKILKEYFRNHYIDRLLIFIFPKFSREEIDKFVEIEGLENLDNALKPGKGVILVHGHFGPVHLPLVALARLGYRMKQIGLPSDEGLSWIGKNVAFRLRMKYESKMPAEIIKADSFLRGAFKWLNDNGVIMITGDGSGTDKRIGRHEVFRFFQQPTMFPLGPAILAERTGAALLPLFIVPGDNGKPYRIVIEKPLSLEQDNGGKSKEITGGFVKRLEYYISRYPGYMHFLDRFCPDGLIVKEAA